MPYLRWIVAFALFVAAFLNYVDRNVLGLLPTTIQKDLYISKREFASIINYFLMAYTIANLRSGRAGDKLGVRWSRALFVAWGTIANAFTGIARSLGQICGLRFMLGLGEADRYMASPEVGSECFPISVSDRYWLLFKAPAIRQRWCSWITFDKTSNYKK